jgi:PAS domain-containing protein
MANYFSDADSRRVLRSRAVEYLRGPNRNVPSDAVDALGVLYELASSPATAPDALALLHELQVHQVEIDLQDEELRRIHVELENSLARQVQLYECAPVGYLTVDNHAVLRKLNQMGAALLGLEWNAACGRSLEGVLTAEGAATLRAMFARIVKGASHEFADLHLRVACEGKARNVHASVCLDPAGEGFLIGLCGVSGAHVSP